METSEGYRALEFNSACNVCGCGSYIAFSDFVARLYVLEFLHKGENRFPDSMFMACNPCPHCKTGFVFRSYFCFTCNKWCNGWLIRKNGSCPVCNRVLLEFLHDEKKLDEFKSKWPILSIE